MSEHFKMYITINGIVGEKTIYLPYSIRNFNSNQEVAVIIMLSDNVQYRVVTAFSIIDSISPDKQKQNPSRTYSGRELISVIEGMVGLTQLDLPNAI